MSTQYIIGMIVGAVAVVVLMSLGVATGVIFFAIIAVYVLIAYMDVKGVKAIKAANKKDQ